MTLRTELEPNPAVVRWFCRVMWLGVAANLAMALPALIAPARSLALLNLPEASPLLWPRFAGWLLIFLSAFYVPGAIDPVRYSLVAWISVLARLGGTLFFLTQPRTYWLLGLFDFVFFVPQAVLLGLLRSARR
jgi:hypothetical protein